MKYISVLLLISIYFSTNAQIAISHQDPLNHYKVTLRDLSGKKIKGFLAGFNDSLVVLYAENPSKKTDDSIAKSTPITIHYQYIDDIWFSRKGRVTKGALKLGLIFAGIAFVATATPIGNLLVASSENESSGSRMAKAAIRAGLAGAIIGGSIGLLPSNYYIIKGSRAEFEKMASTLFKKLSTFYKIDGIRYFYYTHFNM